jgi:hypothetical protein
VEQTHSGAYCQMTYTTVIRTIYFARLHTEDTNNASIYCIINGHPIATLENKKWALHSDREWRDHTTGTVLTSRQLRDLVNIQWEVHLAKLITEA